MSLSVVKLSHNNECVGIFCHDDIYELRELVDQFCAPSECQFATLPNGGIAAAGRGAATLPMRADEIGELPAPVFSDLMPGIVLNWSLADALARPDLEWTALDQDMEHEGSLIDALLSDPAARDQLAALCRGGSAPISLA